MEQRWTERVPKHWNVTLDLPSHGTIARGKSSDVNLEGLFVETDPSHVPPHATVKVTITLDGNSNENVAHQLNAKVIHLEDRGAGLMFKDLDVPTIHALRKSLYHY